MSKTSAGKETGLVEKIKRSEQLISMVLGILVVLIVGGLAYRYFQKQPGLITKESAPKPEQEEAREEKPEKKETPLPTTHEVSRGESLWQIAEKYYQSGYNWVDIARENNLKNPDVLLVGQKLKIPNVPAKKITITQLPKTGITQIQGDKYTVQKGDSLSKIAGAAYGDIFAWPKIWAANRDQIGNPNLIFPGQTLKIPR